MFIKVKCFEFLIKLNSYPININYLPVKLYFELYLFLLEQIPRIMKFILARSTDFFMRKALRLSFNNRALILILSLYSENFVAVKMNTGLQSHKIKIYTAWIIKYNIFGIFLLRLQLKLFIVLTLNIRFSLRSKRKMNFILILNFRI